jgi:hypothetical protein
MAIIYTSAVPAGFIDTDAYPSTYAFNPDGTISTETISAGGSSWVKTYAYTTVNGAQKPSGNPAWVKQ